MRPASPTRSHRTPASAKWSRRPTTSDSCDGAKPVAGSTAPTTRAELLHAQMNSTKR